MPTTITTTGARRALFIDSTDDIDIELTYQDDDGAPVDLTGFLLEWEFTILGVTLLAIVGDGLDLDEAAGGITLHIPANSVDDDDNPLPQGLGEHRLRITAPVVKTLFRGALTNDT